jgi:hypothetical protein
MIQKTDVNIMVGSLGHLIENEKNLKYQVRMMMSKRHVEFMKDAFINHIVTGSS